MRPCLQVLCSDGRSISRREIAEFLQRGTEGSASGVILHPSPSAPESLLDDWDSLALAFSSEERRVILTRFTGSALFRQEIDELISLVSACAQSEQQKNVQRRLREIAQVFLIHFDPSTLAARDWRALDKLESFLAHSLDGIIYAPGEGFFNSDLQRINLLPVKEVILPIHRPQ